MKQNIMYFRVVKNLTRTLRQTMSLNIKCLFTAVLAILVSSSVNATSATAEDAKAIARVYSAAFDREPKTDGLNFWVDSYEDGQGLVSIALRFYESPEFSKKYGELSNVQYVRQLFGNVLGRDGKQSGIDFWVGQLDKGKSRAWVLSKFSDSPENVAKTTSIFADMRYESGQWLFEPETDSAPQEHRVTSLSTGTAHSCVLEDGAPVCWGNNDFGQLNAPALVNPVELCAGGQHTCALDADGIKCWGAGSIVEEDNFRQSGQSIVPELSNPRSLSCGLWTTCAIDDEGAKCWGLNGGETTPMQAQPTKVSAGINAACSITANAAQCEIAGFEPVRDMTDEPVLIAPIDIDVGKYNACAIERDGVVCWGSSQALKNVPPLNNPSQLEVGEGFACALDDNGVICWGGEYAAAGPGPRLQNPRSISVGDYNVCAIDGESVVCWDDPGEFGEGDVPDRLRPDEY